MPQLSVNQNSANLPDELKQNNTIAQDIAVTAAYIPLKVNHFPIDMTSRGPQLLHCGDIGIFIRSHKIFL